MVKLPVLANAIGANMSPPHVKEREWKKEEETGKTCILYPN